LDTLESQSLTAREAGLKACNACGIVLQLDEAHFCPRCGATVLSRRHNSIERVWVLLLVGILAYIPANTLPILMTRSIAGDTSDTIMSGVFELIRHGSYGVAAVIFMASVLIPIAKFIIIAGLALSLHFDANLSDHTRHKLHAITEFIGRWSMIDVFVVAVLAALIQLGAILTILPGTGINCFAVSVVFTMLSASALDPRLLWDKEQEQHGE